MVTFLPLLALAAMPVEIVAPRTVNLPDRAVHLSDVVSDNGALPSSARRIVIARLPAAGGRIDLSRAALASLIRRGLPGIRLADTALTGSVTFVVPRPFATKLSRPVPVAVAQPAVKRGAVLHLISTVGPVRIERPVTALQSSRGKRIFVRDPDGTVFAARVETAESAR
jgi:hypothetical protein